MRTILLSLLLAPAALGQVRIHVDDSATGAGDGTSWQDAYTTLVEAMESASPADEVWVAEGTYLPTNDGEKKDRIEVVCDLYGGFDGTETDLSQRAGLFDTTIVTGDLNGDDGPDFTNRQDNSFALLWITEPVTVDGFTLRGRSEAAQLKDFCTTATVVRNCTFLENEGQNGAVRVTGSGASFIDCTFAGNRGTDGGAASAAIDTYFEGCTFLDNAASFTGGAVHGWCHFVECHFEGNRGDRGGAAGINVGDTNGPWRIVIERCTFVDNGGGYRAGAVYGHATIRDSEFVDNFASDEGGAVMGIRVILEGCTFVGNRAADGGAVYARGSSLLPESPSSATDCVFRDNEGERGGALFGDGAGLPLIVDGCTFETNTAVRGGAAYLEGIGSRAWFTNSTFRANHGSEGGGALYACMTSTVDGCLFLGNTTEGTGGAAWYEGCSGTGRVLASRFLGNAATGVGGGAVWVGPGAAGFELFGCELSGNVADGSAEGAGAVRLDPLVGAARVASCTIAGNSALGPGGGGGLVGNPSEVVNTLLWGNVDEAGQGQSSQLADNHLADGRFDLVHSAVQGWDGSWPGAGSHGGDPLFVDAAGPDGARGTEDDDLRLGPGSAALDVAHRAAYFYLGDTALVPGPAVDVAGSPRWVNALDCGEAAPPDGILDMGAHERATVDGRNVLCEGEPSSLGVPAELLGPCGLSLVAGPFDLTAEPVPDGAATFLASTGHGSVPFGDGTLCLGSTARLGTAVASGGSATLTVDPAAGPGHLFLPGSVLYVQALYRDPAAGGAGFNLSQAVTIVVRP